MQANCYEKAYIQSVKPVQPRSDKDSFLLDMYVSIFRGRKVPAGEGKKTKWDNSRGFNVSVKYWGAQAEEAAPHLARGVRVLMIGQYEFNRWNDSLTGAEKEKLVFIATDIYIKPGSRPDGTPKRDEA